MRVSIKRWMLAAFIIATMPLFAQQADIQFFRQPDTRGLNVFETPKTDDILFQGLRVRVGGAFTQQYQGLNHSNGNDTIDLYGMAPGFNLATANLNFDVQLEDGVRLQLVTYLSSRHHPEAWVKGGFIQFDKLSFLGDGFDWFDKYMTLRLGHYQVNYGDMQFRRTDNGNAMYNPFVGNSIMDAFATEIGGDLTFQHPDGLLAVLGITNGEIQGDITDNDLKGPAFQLKLGWDKQMSDDLRVRFTGSAYMAPSSPRSTLYSGDRSGSRFYLVMSDPGARAGDDFTTGRVNPNLRNEVTSIMLTPFVKYKGIEFFGFYEIANGKNEGEDDARGYNQLLAEVLYRFAKDEQVYVGGRYNTVTGPSFSGITPADPDANITITRMEFGAGWFVTKNLLLKATYVDQTYNDVTEGSKFYEGNFNGFMAEATVAF